MAHNRDSSPVIMLQSLPSSLDRMLAVRVIRRARLPLSSPTGLWARATVPGVWSLQREQIMAQVDVVAKLSGGPGEADRAFLENIHAVGECEREIDALLGEHDR